MTFWQGLDLIAFIVGVVGFVLFLIGCRGSAPATPPPTPDEGPTLISGPEAEVFWFEYQRRLDEWEASDRRGARPTMRLAGVLLLGASLITLGVSIAVDLLG